MNSTGSESRPALQGAITAIVTPFGSGGELDLPALERLVGWQVEMGIDGIAPCGTTGEGAVLDPDEHSAVIETVVGVAAGRVPVVAGCGSNDTRKAVEAAKRAEKAGADALLVVSPYYNKPNRTGMVSHYRAVAQATGLPVVVYNVPGRTGQNLGSELILELAELDGIEAVKEASGDLDQMAMIIRNKPERFSVLSGDDPLALPAVSLGADGVISVASNQAPDRMAKMIGAARSGDMVAARRMHYQMLGLMHANFIETNPVPVKTGLHLLGRCGPNLRPPLGRPAESTVESMRRALVEAGIVED